MVKANVIDMEDLLQEWLAKHPEQVGELLARMVKSGFIKSVDCFELYLGDYERPDYMEMRKLSAEDGV